MTGTHHPLVALITGASLRIGNSIAIHLHEHHFNVVIHYNQSESQAKALAAQLNHIRENSANTLQCNLCEVDQFSDFIQAAYQFWGRLDVLVNNASTFYPTALEEASEVQWNDLFATNAKAPFFLCQKAYPALSKHGGKIVNIIDIHADRPLKQYPIYCAAKAALKMLTQSLAKEMAPKVCVNAISPGAIMWSSAEKAQTQQRKNIIDKIPLQKQGQALDIAQAVLFLIQSNYITGETIRVDGGRHLKQ